MKTLMMAILISLTATGAISKNTPNVWGEWSWPHTEPVHVVVSPGEGGTPLSEAEMLGGSPADATIRIQLWYMSGPIENPEPAPLANFPGEDLWLEFPGLATCWPALLSADGSTDANGWFSFSAPLGLAGWNDPADPLSFPHVVISGSTLYDQDDNIIQPTLVVNSPDINGDLTVNLTDVALFAADFHGPYSFRSDYNWDGVVNLTDLVWMARLMGDQCP